MTPLARVCLASGIGLIGLVPALSAVQPGAAHNRTYVVQANDTLSTIAYRVHSNITELSRINGIVDPNQLQAGQVLSIPDYSSGWTDRDSVGHTAGVPVQTTTYLGSSTGSTVSAGNTLTVPQRTTTYTISGTHAAVAPAQTAYTVSEAGTSYAVAAGDTLSALSRRFGVPMATLAAVNGISRVDQLFIGQRLQIPSSANTGGLALTQASQRLAPATNTLMPAATAVPATSTSVTVRPTTPVTSQGGVGALLVAEAQAYNVDPALVKAVAWQESGWQMVVARDGGIGVMQLMPATAAWVGPSLLGRTIDPYNLQDNVQAGVALLASYLRQYGGNVTDALAAYNEGPQNLAHGILSSTAQYIANVLSLRSGFAQ